MNRWVSLVVFLAISRPLKVAIKKPKALSAISEAFMAYV